MFSLEGVLAGRLKVRFLGFVGVIYDKVAASLSCIDSDGLP